MTAEPFLDRPAVAALLAGSLLIAISVLTNYGHGAFSHFTTIPLDDQIGVCLHTAALAALFGDVELATRLRHRARNNEARRDQLQALCVVAEFRFLLADTPRSRLQLNESIAALLEQIELSMNA
jgi:hypothetical protein